jgi:hypothetical protein
VLPHAWINSAAVRSIPGDLYIYDFSIVISISKELGSGTNGSAVLCISVCLTSLTPLHIQQIAKAVLPPIRNNLLTSSQDRYFVLENV